MPALMAANVLVQGMTNHDCAQGVSSRPNSVACRPRNQRKKLTMGRNSTQFALLPQHDGGIQYCMLPRTRLFAARIGATDARRRASCNRGSGKLGARQRWIQREIALDAAENRIRELLLVLAAFQFQLFVGVGDESGLDQYRRNVRRLQNRKSGLLDAALVQRIHRTDAVEHRAADAQAVVYLRGLRQVEERPRQKRFLAVQVDAPDQVGVIFALREPSRRGAGRAMLRQGENRRATRRRRGERVGMNRNE